MNAKRTVLVTGGGRGIGADISRAFHAADYHVAIAGRSDTGIARELGARARWVTLDVTQRAQHDAAIRQILDWSGRIDVIVNNAGYSGWRRLERIDDAFWNKMLDTNLKGSLYAIQAAAPHMAAGSAVVNVSSLAGKRGTANNTVYCASKFAMNGMTQALAKELGPRGIRVNAVCPVLIPTDGLLEALVEPDAPAANGDVQTFLRNFAAANSARGVLPTGDEVGRACVFLASDGAAAITGQCINVDTGVMTQ
ncbi:MAG TPA: SDR family oxidoreductase [Polyangiales bacterium]|jgi:3-oxoacyl-[acyl-carrier protein] reductase/meso-butanediol dehydrogenase/(S,S)-butanediol dehydrogenase/diacetyl reductase|nr:SDR family oxidoreductase [Polyangiales bacterium]